MTAGTTTTSTRRICRTARYDGVRPSRIVASRAASMLPPDTMHTIRPTHYPEFDPVHILNIATVSLNQPLGDAQRLK